MKNTFMIQNYTRKVLLLSAIFLLTFMSSCKKKGELVPNFDDSSFDVNFTDTVSLVTSVVREDSLRTDVSSLNLLGQYYDPEFGLTTAAIYSQVLLSGVNVDFGTPVVLDSVVLSFKYNNYYGKKDGLTVNVYELTDDMDASTAYYSNQYFNYDPTPIGSRSFLPNVNDSVLVDTVMSAPQLRIKLDNSFGQKLLNASGTVDLSNNTSFLQFFKGFYIVPASSALDSVPGSIAQKTTLSPGDGSMVYFDLNSSVSKLTLYYTNTSTLDSDSYDFIISADCAKFSAFDHDYSGTDIENQLSGSGQDTTLLYVQPLAGVKTKIELPYIQKLKDQGNVAINKAELVFSIEQGSDEDFEAPSSIALVGIDEDGKSVFLTDFFEGTEYFGGSMEPSTKTYTFNISRHVHEIVYGTTPNYGLYLIASGSSVNAERVIITSDKHPTAKLKLNLTYSNL